MIECWGKASAGDFTLGPISHDNFLMRTHHTPVFQYKTNQTTVDASDPSRVVGQIVTGIGFLGAGVMWTKDGGVVGVTSAACVWMIAAIGVTIATVGEWTGIVLSLLTLFVLAGIDYFESSFKWLQRGVHKRVPASERSYNGKQIQPVENAAGDN